MPILQTILISLWICGVSGWVGYRVAARDYRAAIDDLLPDWLKAEDEYLRTIIQLRLENIELTERLAKFDHRNRLRNSKGKFLSTTTREGN